MDAIALDQAADAILRQVTVTKFNEMRSLRELCWSLAGHLDLAPEAHEIVQQLLPVEPLHKEHPPIGLAWLLDVDVE